MLLTRPIYYFLESNIALLLTLLTSQAQRLQVVKQQLRTADNVDLRRVLSVADKPINEDNILATPGLWEYKQSLTLPLVQNMLTTMPPEVRGLNHRILSLKSMLQSFKKSTNVAVYTVTYTLYRHLNSKFSGFHSSNSCTICLFT